MSIPTDPSTPARDERLAAVRRYEILDTPQDGAYLHVAVLAATIFEVPIATVSIVDEDRVWFAATYGLDGVTQVGTEPGLCVSAVDADGPYVVTNADIDLRTRDHPLVTGALGVRFYAAAPIVVAGGHRLGTVNVIDRERRDEVTSAQVSMLESLAAIVADQLDLRLASLAVVRDERDLRARAERHASDAATQIAEAMARTGPSAASRPESCELGSPLPCHEAAEIKVADPWGDSAWGCLAHVEEALICGSSVFVADESMSGLATFRRRGRTA
jgi:phosphoserine phosphatase RsbU/P